MTLAEVLELLGRVQITWPRTRWEAPVEFVGEVWLPYLADLPVDAVRATLIDLPPSPWAPAPAELRVAVLDRIAPDTAPDVDQAWAEVKAGVARWGWAAPYHRPFDADDEPRTWSHPAVADAVEAFGWSNLCNPSDNPTADRAQFRDFYLAARERHRPRRTPPAAAAALEEARRPPRELPQQGGSTESPRPDRAGEPTGVTTTDIDEHHAKVIAFLRRSDDLMPDLTPRTGP